MADRINRAIELLAQDQAIYYVGAHSGHVLTRAQGREDAATWADYINVGMEHGAFDMTGLAEYMAGLVEGGPTRSGHRTPTIIVEAPVNGTDAANVRFNAWQFRQILGRGVHGVLLCQAEIGRRGARVCRSLPLPAPPRRASTRPCPPRSSACTARCRAGRARPARHRHPRARLGSDGGADLGDLGRGVHRALRAVAARPRRRTAARRQARKPGGHRQLRGNPRGAGSRLCRARAGRPRAVARLRRGAARALPARDARGARARPCRLPRKTASPFSKPARRRTSPPSSTRGCASSPATARKPRSVGRAHQRRALPA